MWSTSVEVWGCGLLLVLLVTRLVLKVGGAGRSAALQSAVTLRVLVVNERSALGREVCARLRAAGCLVNSEDTSRSVDALVVAGGTRGGPGLHSLVDLVTADLYHTIKEVQHNARRVKAGGRILWVATDAPGTDWAVRDSFSGAADAFDRVIKLQLEHIAHSVKQCGWAGGATPGEPCTQSYCLRLTPGMWCEVCAGRCAVGGNCLPD